MPFGGYAGYWGVSKRNARPWLVDDELWSRVEPLLPSRPAGHRRPGRKPVLEDRQVLCGVLFVLYTGIQWEWLPQSWGSARG